MFAQLGDHIFQGLKTPGTQNEYDAVKYGQVPHVNGKAAIQPTGAELREINLSIQYSSEFCEPTTEINALKKSMQGYEVLPYIMGDGRIIGKFVITSVETSTQRCSADGTVEMAVVNINLLESPGGPAPEPIGQALSSQKPITEPPIQPTPSPASSITNDIAEGQSKVNGIKSTMANMKNRTTDLKRGVREVRQLATDTQTAYAAAKTKVTATTKIASRASELPASLDEAMRYAENLAKVDDLVDYDVLQMNVEQLSISADKVMERSAPVVGFVATKEGGN